MIPWGLLFLFASCVRASPFIINESDVKNTKGITPEQCSWTSPEGIRTICWEVLGMNKYLEDWWSANGELCKSAGKGFSQCYLDTAGFLTWQCDFVALNACPPPPSGNNANYSSNQEFYVIWNIYNLNLFWTNFHSGLVQGQAGALATVAEIVGVVAPPKTKYANSPKFPPVFGAILGQIGMLGPLLGPSMTASIVFASAMGAAGITNPVFMMLFPPKEEKQVSWEELSGELAELVNDFQKQIGLTLEKIQTDFATFFAATAFGGFSQKLRTNLPENTDFMYHDLLKWVLNQALQQADYFAVKNPGVDPRLIPIDPYDCSRLDPTFNTCGPIWYDGKDAYGLARANDLGMDRMEEIVKTAFERNWTTPHELYIDSQKCQGRNGSEAFDVSDLELSCASNIPVCEFYFDYNPFQALQDRSNPPEFINCPNQRGYGIPFYYGKTSGVPLTYLGPFLGSGVKYNEK
ncbi:hypothetical protein C8034_v006429 [Colletotrichum sidae]|uniref:Uncharacterized protein n=1 Tax=Colletotrichum sidae TaxID=1347389 RepID=A0A4R8T521_9PEZI|nr:hypothetical protein C8034_v006429 [Colletotrichum sidae]